MAWRLNTALTNWRAAVDRAYPNRDRASDGTIGDAAHAAGTSDHNEDPDGTVDAWDMDVDLRSGNDAAAIEALKRAFQAHPAARYWIHNRQIAHRNNGWRREAYAGANPHDKHVHWNSNEATEDSTAPWILEDDMTPQELLGTKVASPALGDRTVADWLKGGQSAANKVDALASKVDALAQVVATLATPGAGQALMDKLQEIDDEATARAAAEEQRDAEQRAWLEQHDSGQLSAEEVVQRLAERLAA